MFLRTLRIVLFAILISSTSFAETTGYINLNGTPSFVSKDGYNLILGTEGDDDVIVVQNDAQTFRLDGSASAPTISINTATIDGVDSGKLGLSGGGVAFSSSRGAQVNAYGNEHATKPGYAEIVSGNVASSEIFFDARGTASVIHFQFDNDNNRLINFTSGSDTAVNQIFGDTGTTASQVFNIRSGTSNTDDDGTLCATGGGICGDAARGSYLYLAGADLGGANLGDAQVAASDDFYISTGVSGAIRLTINESGLWTVGAGDIGFGTSGNTIALQEATAGAACSGTLTFNGATPVVTSTTCATTGSRIFFTRTSAESTALNPYVSAISNGVSFSVTSEAGDTGTANWVIFHESAG